MTSLFSKQNKIAKRNNKPRLLRSLWKIVSKKRLYIKRFPSPSYNKKGDETSNKQNDHHNRYEYRYQNFCKSENAKVCLKSTSRKMTSYISSYDIFFLYSKSNGYEYYESSFSKQQHVLVQHVIDYAPLPSTAKLIKAIFSAKVAIKVTRA